MTKKNEEEQWIWQEPETAWKGVGIYHITMVVSSRKPLLGELVIPDNDPEQARVELTPFHFILHVKRKMEIGIKAVIRGFWQGAKIIGRAYTSSIIPNDFRSQPSRKFAASSIVPNDIRSQATINKSVLLH